MALPSLSVNTTCLPERSTTALFGTANASSTLRFTRTLTFMPSRRSLPPSTDAHTFTIPFSSTIGLISVMRPVEVLEGSEKGATLTASPVESSASSLSITLNSTSIPLSSMMRHSGSEPERLWASRVRLATTPLTGAVSVASSMLRFDAASASSACPRPLRRRASAITSSGTRSGCSGS